MLFRSSEYSFQDVVLPLDEDLLEAMTSLGIPSGDVAMVLSNDHIVELDYPATKPRPSFPSEPDLTISRSSYSYVYESFDSIIELQIGVPYAFDVSHRCLDSPDDESLPIQPIIGVDFGLPVKYDLPMCRPLNFGLEKSSLIDSTKVMNTIKDIKVDDTYIQVTINRSIPLNLLHTITVLLFLRYMTLS